MRRWKRRSCSSSETENQYFTSWMPGADQHSLELRRRPQEVPVLRVRAEAHHPLDAGAVVPGAVEDHDLTRRRQVGDVALEVPLGALPLGRRRQRDHAGVPRVHVLDDPLDGPALPGRVAALDDDEEPVAVWRTQSCIFTSSTWSLASSRSKSFRFIFVMPGPRARPGPRREP